MDRTGMADGRGVVSPPIAVTTLRFRTTSVNRNTPTCRSQLFLSIAVLAAVALILAGLTVPVLAHSAEAAGFSGHRQLSDLAVAWEIVREKDRLSVTGSLRNTRHYPLEEIEARVRLLNRSGSEIGRGIFVFPPVPLAENGSLPFGLAITLPAGVEPSAIELVFFYLISDGDDDLPSFQGIEIDLAEGGIREPPP